MDIYDSISKLLRTEREKIKSIDETMSNIYGDNDVLEGVLSEIEKRKEDFLSKINIQSRKADDIAKGIQEELKEQDKKLNKALGNPELQKDGGAKELIKEVKELGGNPKGFFMKKEKAKDMLRKTPPKNIMDALGYSSIDKLLKNEKLKEIFPALRFVESREWMNEEFLPQYDELTKDDFERREIEVEVLPTKWLDIAEEFVEKKYHNVSHLKELGFIFVIPLEINTPGETLRLFALLLHYMHEVPFYSKVIKREAENKSSEEFAKSLVELLRGDVKEVPSEFSKSKAKWLIVQRYLSKDDADDPRLFVPHVNPEAIHWRKAEEDIATYSDKKENLDLDYFKELDHIGGFFENEGEETLVSFDLVDSVMSLISQKHLLKYMYHQQEALWNEIFREYVGNHGKIERLIIENLVDGYIELE